MSDLHAESQVVASLPNIEPVHCELGLGSGGEEKSPDGQVGLCLVNRSIMLV